MYKIFYPNNKEHTYGSLKSITNFLKSKKGLELISEFMKSHNTDIPEIIKSIDSTIFQYSGTPNEFSIVNMDRSIEMYKYMIDIKRRIQNKNNYNFTLFDNVLNKLITYNRKKQISDIINV